MKKIIMFFVIFYFTIMSRMVYADGTTVEVSVTGEIKVGQSISIAVDVKNVEKFYAGSVDFIYDTELIRVNSIKATDFITKHSTDIMELGGETDKNGNTASYSFTFLGDKDGIKGSGKLVTIEATVLKNGNLVINEDNMKVKLVKRDGNSVSNYEYSFSGYSTLEDTEIESDNNNSAINNGSNGAAGIESENTGTDNKDEPIINGKPNAGDVELNNPNNFNHQENLINKNEFNDSISSVENNDETSNKVDIIEAESSNNIELTQKVNKKNNISVYIIVAIIMCLIIVITYCLHKKRKDETKKHVNNCF